MNSNNTFCNSNSSTLNGLSSYWRQFDVKPKTSSGYSGSGSSSSYSGSSNNFRSGSSGGNQSYYVPSFANNTSSGLKIW